MFQANYQKLISLAVNIYSVAIVIYIYGGNNIKWRKILRAHYCIFREKYVFGGRPKIKWQINWHKNMYVATWRFKWDWIGLDGIPPVYI